MNLRLPIPVPHSFRGSRATRRFAMWPISLGFYPADKFAWRLWFTWHGWETGADAFAQLVYGWTFHLGPLKVFFGDRDYGR